jgi:xanthine/CO dehydrogenase XdhC/CoxF family maturation factor
VGLPLGGRSPEAIALAIVAELHAFLHPQEREGLLRRFKAL